MNVERIRARLKYTTKKCQEKEIKMNWSKNCHSPENLWLFYLDVDKPVDLDNKLSSKTSEEIGGVGTAGKLPETVLKDEI